MNDKIFKHKWEKVALMILVPCLLLVMFAPCDVFADIDNPNTVNGMSAVTFSYPNDERVKTRQFTTVCNLACLDIVVLYPKSGGSSYNVQMLNLFLLPQDSPRVEVSCTYTERDTSKDGTTKDYSYPQSGVLDASKFDGERYVLVGSLSPAAVDDPSCVSGGNKIVLDSESEYNSLMASIADGTFNPSDYEIQYDKGSYDNPTIDNDIGRPIIKNSSLNIISNDFESGNDSIEKTREKFEWKKKTDTGFNLVSNSYAQTYLEVYVESKCYVKGLDGGIKKKFANYGEKEFLRKYKASELGCTIDYEDIAEALPKTHSEIHNPLFCSYSYTLWMRVVATKSTAVIPEQAANDWVRGQWVTLDISSDFGKRNDDRETNAYDEDEDGNIKKNDDSDANKDNVNVGPSGGNDEDSAQDAYDDAIDKKNNESKVDMSSWKENAEDLIYQIKYIPEMIKAVFSFLPDWCLVLLGCIFTLLLVVIIMKFIRG